MRGCTPEENALNGFINLYKSDDMTSSDAVCIVRGIMSKASGVRQKVGHLGTLDPLAEGVLPIAVGKATRLFDLLAFKRKKYLATFVFGVQTDTLDRGGKTVYCGGRIPTAEEIESVLPSFVGKINQIPPTYSSKSVNGKRAYEYARKGQQVELAPKSVEIYSLRATNRQEKPCTDGTDDTIGEYSFEIECGGGTYIRAIARDMAEKLGTYAYMSSLRRLSSGDFDCNSAITLDVLRNAENPTDYLIPTEFALRGLPRRTIPSEQLFRLLNGVPVRDDTDESSDALFTVFSEDSVLQGIGSTENGTVKLKIRL